MLLEKIGINSCPFCGELAGREERRTMLYPEKVSTVSYLVRCVKCGAAGPQVGYISGKNGMEEAIKKWNIRTGKEKN